MLYINFIPFSLDDKALIFKLAVTATFSFLFIYTFIKCSYRIYERMYFSSGKFLDIKSSFKDQIDNMLDFNSYVQSLENLNYKNPTIEGTKSELRNSGYRYKNNYLNRGYNPNHCVTEQSRGIVKNSQLKPYKYLMKYFDFKAEREEIDCLEEMLDKIVAIEEGRELLRAERSDIIASMSKELPFLIRKLSRRSLIRELGIPYISNNDSYIPVYEFRYVSTAGRNQLINIIKFTPERLEEFISYLSDKLDKRNSRAGQRALLTRELRQEILKRDNYTCCECGANLEDEPHLLLEVDHIIPIAKNGLTIRENLHTLCWKCNRSKGTKVDTSSKRYRDLYNAHIAKGVTDIPIPDGMSQQSESCNNNYDEYDQVSYDDYCEQNYFVEPVPIENQNLYQDIRATLDYIDNPDLAGYDVMAGDYYQEPIVNDIVTKSQKLKLNINRDITTSSAPVKKLKINISNNTNTVKNVPTQTGKFKVNLPTLG